MRLCLEHAKAHGKNKYNAKRVRGDLRTFDSQGEHARAVELEMLQKAGEISGLRYQVVYPLFVNGIRITGYRCDFLYLDERNKRVVVEDFKGVRTDLYLIKRRLMEACYGIVVLESGPEKKRRKRAS